MEKKGRGSEEGMGREENGRRREGEKTGKGSEREENRKLRGSEKGRMKGQVKKWESGEGNQNSGNFMHP